MERHHHFMSNQFDPNPFGSNQPRVNITMGDTSPYNCSCGNGTFTQGFILRKVNVLIGGDGNFMRIPVTYCIKCGKYVQELIPPDLRPPVDVETNVISS